MPTDAYTGSYAGRMPWARLHVPALAVCVATLGACDGILDVDLPGEITEQDLFQPEMAELLVTSAIADFECSFAEFVASIGGLEDVFWESTGWFTRAWAEYRITSPAVGDCGTSDTAAQFFVQFQTSRYMAEQAYDSLAVYTADQVRDRERLMATAATYAGYVYQLFGEHFCEMTVDVARP
jgi:hypothetical protein